MVKKSVRIEIRLPTHYNNRRKIEPEKHSQTIEEMYEKFGAFTFMGITDGGWRDPSAKKSYREKMLGFFVDIDKEKFSETVKFFRKYKEILKKRFKQEVIYIVGYELYVI